MNSNGDSIDHREACAAMIVVLLRRHRSGVLSDNTKMQILMRA